MMLKFASTLERPSNIRMSLLAVSYAKMHPVRAAFELPANSRLRVVGTCFHFLFKSQCLYFYHNVNKHNDAAIDEDVDDNDDEDDEDDDDEFLKGEDPHVVASGHRETTIPKMIVIYVADIQNYSRG